MNNIDNLKLNKRDHRALGAQLDFFSSSQEIGQGLVLWHPKGAMVRYLLENFSQSAHILNGYEWVYTPHIGRSELWKTSGHLQFYKDSMYSAIEIDDEEYGALCHAIGHAGATVHVETHALGLPFYELTALVIKYGKNDYQKKVCEKINYYCDRLTYWQKNIDMCDVQWANFLLVNRPNKEKLLNEKCKDSSAQA
jgi:seryl-tRNA synthetase